jgi:hypothetical protein
MSSNVVAAFLPSHFVCSDQLVVVASSSPAVLALLSSVVHDAWTRLFASTLGDGIRYTPSDVFETFPLPTSTFAELEAHPALCEVGAELDRVRSSALRELGIGNTALLGRIARGDGDGEIGKVVDAKRALDEAVVRAYGWQDLARTRENREILRRLFERRER